MITACVTLAEAKHAFLSGLLLGSAVTFTLAVITCMLRRRYFPGGRNNRER